MFAVGMGSSCATADGNIRSPDEPRWFGPPFVPSVARGVGSKSAAEDEAPVSAMGCADLVSPQHCPPELIPESGQVTDGSGKFPSGNDGRHVLQEHVSGDRKSTRLK